MASICCTKIDSVHIKSLTSFIYIVSYKYDNLIYFFYFLNFFVKPNVLCLVIDVVVVVVVVVVGVEIVVLLAVVNDDVVLSVDGNIILCI